MQDNRKQGKVKFYSSDKGYGFLFCEGMPDVFFHITQVDGAEPPKIGDVVTFVLNSDQRTGKASARALIIQSQDKESSIPIVPQKQLDGFPCIRGATIYGFMVTDVLGHIIVGKGWFSDSYGSVSEAEGALVYKANRKGANAIINFVWHNNRQRVKGLFGYYNKDNFWAEGVAVKMKPKRDNDL